MLLGEVGEGFFLMLMLLCDMGRGDFWGEVLVGVFEVIVGW